MKEMTTPVFPLKALFPFPSPPPFHGSFKPLNEAINSVRMAHPFSLHSHPYAGTTHSSLPRRGDPRVIGIDTRLRIPFDYF